MAARRMIGQTRTIDGILFESQKVDVRQWMNRIETCVSAVP
jgi:hypothetical protein